MSDALLKPFESAINFALSLDNDSQTKLAPLDGYIFALDCQSPEFQIFAQIAQNNQTYRVILTQESERAADVTLSGTAAAFFNVAHKGMGIGSVSRSGIRVSGDIEAGQRIQRIVQNLDLDWESLIANYVGDLPARKLGNFMRDMAEWAKQSSQYSQENMRDYFAEERKWIIANAEFEAFEEQVDSIRSNVDRLEARLKLLVEKS